MTVELTGRDLTIDAVVSVARRGEAVSLDRDAVERMRSARAVVERALERGDEIYGLTTGVGAGKTRPVAPREAGALQWSLLRSHLIAQGPAFAPDVVRAAALALVNGFAAGWSGVRPELAAHLVETLNRADLPEVHSLGSVGQGDLGALAELAVGVFDGLELAAGEGLALLSSNAFATGHAALAIADAAALVDALDRVGAISLEAFGANLGMLDAVVGEARPFPGLQTSLERMRTQLEGSALWEPGAPRNLQDPLSFRSLPQVHGAARDALAFAATQVTTELHASQSNPLVLAGEDRTISVANFDSQSLATALDVMRIGLAPAVLASGERAVKLLDASWSGLPRGLVDPSVDGLSFLGITAQSLAAEASLLAAPVSVALASTAHAEGIEDRTSLAPLAARRADEMLDLANRVVAIELVVAAQAIDLGDRRRVGDAVGRLRDRVRELVPAATLDHPEPPDVQPVVELLRSGVASGVI